MTDDAQLLRLYAETRSESAFAELVQRHVDLVYSTALRQLNGDTHLAQDVAQNVFTALARKASSLSSHCSVVGWLYLGAQHAAAQAVRSEQRRRTREQEAYRMHELSHDSSGIDDWDRVSPLLDEAMHELPPLDRDAVLLRYFEQRPFAEVGATLNVSEDAARMRVDRALEKLRGLLGRPRHYLHCRRARRRARQPGHGGCPDGFRCRYHGNCAHGSRGIRERIGDRDFISYEQDYCFTWDRRLAGN